MSFTPAEIESVRRYLGYPGLQTHVDAIADQAALLSAETEATIRAHLRQLDRLQTQITSTVPFAAETFNSGAGGTRQYGIGQRMKTLHDEANRYISEIASTLQLGVYRRIYGQSQGQSNTIRA